VSAVFLHEAQGRRRGDAIWSRAPIVKMVTNLPSTVVRHIKAQGEFANPGNSKIRARARQGGISFVRVNLANPGPPDNCCPTKCVPHERLQAPGFASFTLTNDMPPCRALLVWGAFPGFANSPWALICRTTVLRRFVTILIYRRPRPHCVTPTAPLRFV